MFVFTEYDNYLQALFVKFLRQKILYDSIEFEKRTHQNQLCFCCIDNIVYGIIEFLTG